MLQAPQCYCCTPAMISSHDTLLSFSAILTAGFSGSESRTQAREVSQITPLTGVTSGDDEGHHEEAFRNGSKKL